MIDSRAYFTGCGLRKSYIVAGCARMSGHVMRGEVVSGDSRGSDDTKWGGNVPLKNPARGGAIFSFKLLCNPTSTLSPKMVTMASAIHSDYRDDITQDEAVAFDNESRNSCNSLTRTKLETHQGRLNLHTRCSKTHCAVKNLTQFR
jgi:hypothetical protein